jgi:uncharacterized phiE125 gp8 family phage protein
MYEILEPGVSPITLERAKEHLRVDTAVTSEDTLIETYIKASYKSAEEYTWSKIATTKVREYYQSWSQILKTSLPVSSDTFSIFYIDENGVTQTLAQDTYKLDKLCNEFYYITEPALPELSENRNKIYIEYYTGYAEVPEDIVVAMLLMITEYYDERIDNIEQIFNINGMYSKSSYILLNNYRRNGFGATTR